MEITIDKSALLKEISLTQGIVERKSTVPILSNFLFEANGSNLLITATDLEISLRTFCAAKVIKPGSCAIPGRKFFEYLRLLRDGDINIKAMENHWVQIRSGRSHTKMAGMPRDNFPVLPLFPAQSAIQLPASVIRDMIGRTIFAISQEESRYTLQAGLLVIKPGSITMVATDGHRLAHIETVDSKVSVNSEVRVLIPRKALAEISTLLNSSSVDTIGFAKDQTALFFAIGARLLTSRQSTGNFPNYEAVLPRDLNKSVEVPADQLAHAVQRVSQFSDDRSNAIRLRMEKDHLRLSSSCAEKGESEDLIETSYNGDPMIIGFNSRYLLEFLKVEGGGKVRFHFKATDAAAEFRTDQTSAEHGGLSYRYIVMPIRS